ncbi:hypothetical protein X928_08840 [Petrotoga miotherma DSM 10691]|uniref:Uncharacterized protein n=1 Tax=Petrotoga miotherma DSM 10691 TaxID=1434326 RepID=A0A2K1P810_9BACT|nr:hypothetical protein X928_08840 [Petrotoga miotherma DSM 10691]
MGFKGEALLSLDGWGAGERAAYQKTRSEKK